MNETVSVKVSQRFQIAIPQLARKQLKIQGR
jgi:bifunctional DNA-binding transcriptional regulator/antitoxin component of YhaV-PrlF toxin-antitoxin module